MTRTTPTQWVELANMLLDQVSDVTVEDLVMPFTEWLDGLGGMHLAVEAVAHVEDIDPLLFERATQLSTMLDRVGDLIAAVAMTRVPGLESDATNAGTMARGVFEAITRGPDLRVTLIDPAFL